MDRVRAKLHADEAHRREITGRGVTVAVLDSGCSLHPDYACRIAAFSDLVNKRADCYDDASHGTHVAGIIGGDGRSLRGRYRGIAPGCRLLPLKVLDRRGEGDIPDLIRGIDWAIAHRRQYGIRILNLSAGSAKGEQEESVAALVRKVEEAWNCGMVVVVAAGNMGPQPGSVTAPGNSRKVITVGSSEQWETGKRGGAAEYSGCGPTDACICKPDLVAPGTNVVSCSSSWQKGRYYGVKSGTSMAAPAVSGCIALLLEREPQLTNLQVKLRLREACTDLGFSKNRQGWGMPDLRRLLRL